MASRPGVSPGTGFCEARRPNEPPWSAANEIRAIALALPESVEVDHHGFPSFRVAEKSSASFARVGRG
jgi:hypothetical protein